MKTLISVFQDEFSVFLEILKLIVLFNVQKNFLLPSVCGRLLAYILFRLSTVSNFFGRSVYWEDLTFHIHLGPSNSPLPIST